MKSHKLNYADANMLTGIYAVLFNGTTHTQLWTFIARIVLHC